MKRVTITPAGLLVVLVLMTLFALAGFATGCLLLASCRRLATTTGSSVVGFAASGVALIGLAAGASRWLFSQWSAVRAIDVAGDGSWTLIDWLGRRRAVHAGVPRTIELVTRSQILWRPLPTRSEVVTAHVVAGDLSRRLSDVRPSTIRRVLAELESAKSPPAQAGSAL